MENFTFCSPTEFVFGRDTESQVGDYLKKYGANKVLIHYGGQSAKKSGLIDRVCASLDEAGLDYVTLGGVHPNPREDKVREGIELAKKEGVDFILAVGGGSTIDSSKAIAMGALDDGDFWDFYEKKRSPKAALPVATILTIAAAGSEGSPNTVITNRDGFKRGFKAEFLRPKFSIMNPELTTTLPPYQTASGITDMLAHLLERYFTDSSDVSLTDRMAEGIMKSILEEAPKVIADPNDYEARANLMWAGMLAHNNITGVGRTQDWASHHLEHELSARYDVAHGAGLAVIFPAWMDYVRKIDPGRVAQLGRNIFGVDMNLDDAAAAELTVRRFRDFLRSIGMPLTFDELGAKREDIPALVEKMKMDGRTEGAYVKLDGDQVREIFELACEPVQ